MSDKSKPKVPQKQFRRLTVKMYTKMLKAWIVSTNPVTSNSVDNSFVLKSNEKTDDFIIKTNDRKRDLTIDLNDSLESIPESPEFVEKRKSINKIKSNSNKRLVSKFFDFEAEVAMDSKESFSDDIEDTQRELENSSQTIIDNTIPVDSQPIGQLINGIDSRNTSDMQSVYLRSVRDQSIGNTNKYKLQYSFDPNIDVFSQEPTESDLEDYQFDSFCVPNDTIELDESSPQTGNKSVELLIESPVVPKNTRKKFKRIVFNESP